MNRRILILALGIALLAAALPIPVFAAQEAAADDDKTLAPYFVVENADSSVDSFPLKATDVTATINDTIADIYVVQTYENKGKTPINADYVFPASTNASVHGMKMKIGDNTITAQIKKREEARQEYEAAKSEGKSASLLEQQRPNVFSMSVANVMPGDTVRIELHYTERIVATENVYEFVFPTIITPRYSSLKEGEAAPSDQWVATPYLHEGDTGTGTYNITVNLSTAVPVTDITSGSHDIETEWSGDRAARVTLSNPDAFAGDRDYILRYKLTGQELQTGLMLQTGEAENFFMLTVQPPDRVQVSEAPAREYIFILDVSGSMNGFPLNTAKDLIKDLLTNLRAIDRFNLVLFSNTSLQMSPQSMQATPDNINGAISLIDEEFGSGGTELLQALERAVAIPQNSGVSRSVIVITDGAIATEEAVFDFIAANVDNTNYFSFGIGSAVNRLLVEGMASAGQGESFVATQPSEVPAIADRFRTYVESPVLTDIRVTYSGFDVYDTEPADLPVLFAQRPIVLLGKWRGSLANASVQITGKTGGQDYAQTISLADLEPSETDTAIRYLWARKTVERLIDYGSYTYAPDTEERVTEIGLNYSMMTPYTSFVAVLETVRGSGDSKDVNQPLPLPSGVSDLAVGGDEPWESDGSNPGTGSGGRDWWIYAVGAALLFAGLETSRVSTAGRGKSG